MRGQSDGSHDLADVALYVCICVCVELADDVQGQFDGSHDLTDIAICVSLCVCTPYCGGLHALGGGQAEFDGSHGLTDLAMCMAGTFPAIARFQDSDFFPKQYKYC